VSAPVKAENPAPHKVTTHGGWPDFLRFWQLRIAQSGWQRLRSWGITREEVSMSRMNVARSRFQAALQALEDAAGGVGEGLDAAARGAEQVAQLEAERDRLLARVSELEDEIAALSSVTQEVEGRLDGAIGEIRAALAR
jgi:hypothetical protein